MPIRSTRPRKSEGLRKWIVPLYEKKVLRFLTDTDYEPVKILIYGPGTSRYKPSKEETTVLRQLWQELRADILAAHAEHSAEGAPWGARFFNDE